MSSTKVDVNETIIVHIVSHDEKLLSWVHSHGMEKFGLPELEMRDVPLVFSFAAGVMINVVADYMFNEKRVKLGEVVEHDRELFYLMRLEPMKGQEDHYSCDRWALLHPIVAVRKIEKSTVCCDGCRNIIMAFLLAEDGYEAGSDDINECLDRLVHDGTVIRMPRPKGSKEATFVPSARGVAVYEQKKGQVKCSGDN